MLWPLKDISYLYNETPEMHRQNFNKIRYPLLGSSSFISKHNSIQLHTNTTLLYNSIYHFSVHTHIKQYQHHPAFKFSPKLNIFLNRTTSIQAQVNLRNVANNQDLTYSLSIFKMFQQNAHIVYKLKFDRQFRFKKWTGYLNTDYSSFKINENELKMTFVSTNQYIKPYLQTDFNSLNNTILGVQLKLKSFELSMYTKVRKPGYTTSLSINLKEGWRLGFQIGLGFKKFLFSFYVQRHSVILQIPLWYDSVDDSVQKYTLYGLLLVFAGTVLKCFQQPIAQVYEENKDQRIAKTRESFKLLEKKTKQNYQFEKQNNGLIILEAYYGRSEDIRKIHEEKQLNQNNNKIQQFEPNLEFLDVTLACQFYTKNKQLKLPNISKSKLRGFCDPCENECQKSLLIIYQIRGDNYIKLFDDNEEVTII